MKGVGEVKIYHRKADIFNIGIPIGPKVHSTIEDWGGKYWELIDDKGIIRIGFGNLGKMLILTNCLPDGI